MSNCPCYEEPFGNGEFPFYLVSPAGVIERIADLSRDELEAVVEAEERAIAFHSSLIRSIERYIRLMDEVAGQIQQGFYIPQVRGHLGLGRVIRAIVPTLTEEQIAEARRAYLDACDDGDE